MKLLGELLDGRKPVELLGKLLEGGSRRVGVASARGGRGAGGRRTVEMLGELLDGERTVQLIGKLLDGVRPEGGGESGRPVMKALRLVAYNSYVLSPPRVFTIFVSNVFGSKGRLPPLNATIFLRI